MRLTCSTCGKKLLDRSSQNVGQCLQCFAIEQSDFDDDDDEKEQPKAENESSIKVIGQGYHINKYPKPKPEAQNQNICQCYIDEGEDFLIGNVWHCRICKKPISKKQSDSSLLLLVQEINHRLESHDEQKVADWLSANWNIIPKGPRQVPAWDELRHALNILQAYIEGDSAGSRDLKEAWNLISDFITKNDNH